MAQSPHVGTVTSLLMAVSGGSHKAASQYQGTPSFTCKLICTDMEVLTVSGSVVRPGDQYYFFVNSAERLELCIEGTSCSPHDEYSVIRLQEFQELRELLF